MPTVAIHYWTEYVAIKGKGRLLVSNLLLLSELVKTKNAVDSEIASIIERPANIGHAGEFIAAEVFGIQLEESASHKGSDGYFKNGPLAGRSVNIKWFAKHTGLLDLNPDSLPDFYLVLTGPRTAAGSSRGTTLPWVIEKVFLFNSIGLKLELQGRGVKLGVATSVIARLWEDAEIYPELHNKQLVLTKDQCEELSLFR